ncbi:hypothetical protein GCM10010440_74790 [Kitasatospora cinereorecta]
MKSGHRSVEEEKQESRRAEQERRQDPSHLMLRADGVVVVCCAVVGGPASRCHRPDRGTGKGGGGAGVTGMHDQPRRTGPDLPLWAAKPLASYSSVHPHGRPPVPLSGCQIGAEGPGAGLASGPIAVW